MTIPGLSRRGALGLVLAGLTVSGCDAIAPDGSETPAPDNPGTTPSSPATEPTDDADAALLVDVTAEVGAALALATAAAAARPGLAHELAAFQRLHRRHLERLPEAASEVPDPDVRGSAARVRARVAAREQQLQEALGGAALSAESGPLAALLASMAAAVAQQRAAAGDGVVA